MAKLVVIAFLLALISHATAEIKTLTLTSDPRAVILLQNFAFDYTGHVTVSASAVSTATTTHSSVYIAQDPSRFGFCLLSDESFLHFFPEFKVHPNFCILDSRYIVNLFTFRDLIPPPHSSFNNSYPITSPGLYSLYFINCVPDSRVSMKVHTELYNLDVNGSKDYLSIGQSQLIPLSFGFSLAYLVFLVFWIYCGHSKRKSMDIIHLLMAGMLALKAVTLICYGLVKYFIKITGTAHGWNIVFYGAQVAFWLLEIALISAGLSFLNPYLEGREKKMLMTGITLQVIATLVPAAFHAFGKPCPLLFLASVLVHIICTSVVLFATLRSIRSLREVLKTDQKAALKSTKMKWFASMYILVIFYVYVTRIIVLALKVTVVYQYQWVSNAVAETAALAFYVVMLGMCRPIEENDYSVVDGEEEDNKENQESEV